MRRNLFPICLLLVITVLAGCDPQAGGTASSPQVPDASATYTPFLPLENTATVATDTPIPSPTDTGTATITQTGTPTPSLQVTLDAVGDIMLARTVGDQVLAQGPGIVFAGVQSALDEADLRLGNLECAISRGGTPEHKSYTLQAPPETAQALALGKFDLLSLANNHAMDYGYPGLAETQTYLGQYGIATVGAGVNASAAHMPVLLERNGLRLAFLAYADVPVEIDGFDTHDWAATDTTPGIAWADPNQIAADVTAAKSQADVVIVLLHAGYELNSAPNANQRREAHAAIDAGAALVIGSHPHILQATEQYHGGLIAYSLGNFVFDNYLGVLNATAILHVVLTREGVQSYDFIPMLIEDGLPRLADLSEAPVIGTLVAPLTP